MTYTILSARFANEQSTAAVIATAEAGDVLISQVDTPELWSRLAGVEVAPYPQATPEQIQADYTARIQQRLDEFARTRGYDGILSACTYAASTVAKFQAEGQYCVNARDATWAKGYEVMGAVQAGARPMPTWEQIEAELPALAWPA